VAAEHRNDCAVIFLGEGNGSDNAQEIPRDQDIGERLEKRREAAILAGRGRKFGGGDFVWPALDRNCANLR
jgi:hypothetical protein